MKVKQLYIWSILLNIIGIIVGFISANNFNLGRFLPMFINEKFNFSIFFLILIIFWTISLIFFIKGHRRRLSFENAATISEYEDNYQIKVSLKKYSLISLFIILYIISFIFWMLLYDNNNQYCYFLCTLFEVIIISLIVPFLFSFMIILLIKLFKKKKDFFLK